MRCIPELFASCVPQALPSSLPFSCIHLSITAALERCNVESTHLRMCRSGSPAPKHLPAHFQEGPERILPLHDADAGPADGVLEGETQQRSRRPRGCGRGLFLGLRAVVLSLPLRGTGRGDGPAPSRPEPRASTRCGVSHHLRLPRGVDGRLPAQRCPRRGYMLGGQAHHTKPVISASSSSPSIVVAVADAAAVLIGEALGRRPSKRGRGRIVGAWGEREKGKRRGNKIRLKPNNTG